MALSSPNDFDADTRLPPDGKPVNASVPELSTSAPSQPGSVEFSAPLETSVPLEAPRLTYRVPPNPPVASQPLEPQPETGQLSALDSLDHSIDVVDEALIPLLEERLVINRRRRKVGEVVVRKEIETHIVEVPIRREKLIVEQVSPEYKQLAVVDSEQTQIDESNLSDTSLPPTVSAKFASVDAAIEFLAAIAAHPNSGLTTVQISLILADENLQAAYQQWLEKHST